VTTAADPTNYPSARPKRSAGAATEDLSSFQAPRTRIFPFAMTIAANKRYTVSTPRVIGPLIIKGIVLEPAFGSDPPHPSMEIGTSAAPVTENGVATSVLRPYTPLLEVLDPFGVLNNPRAQGILATSVSTLQRFYETPLDLIVTLTECFVTVSFHNVGAGAASFQGHVRVLEGVDRDALRFFL